MKTALKQTEHDSIAAAMHIVALSAIARAKTWLPGELAFQGGTALHLAYGSLRYSEDLNFMAKSDAGLARIARSASAQIQSAMALMYPGSTVSVKARDADDGDGEPRNPRMFTFTFTPSADRLGSVKVRLEFWVSEYTDQYRTTAKTLAVPALRSLHVRLAPVRVYSALMQTGTLPEILVDKVLALACRDYPKPRDLFDLWLILGTSTTRPDDGEPWPAAIERHAQMYSSPPVEEFPQRLRDRAAYFATPAGRQSAITDLKRWLAGANLADEVIGTMVDHVLEKINGIADQINAELSAPRSTPGVERE